jgi:hypothetical protein
MTTTTETDSGQTHMVKSFKSRTFRELEQLAHLIEDAAFCAAADAFWEEIETGAVPHVDSRPVLKMAASGQNSAAPAHDSPRSGLKKLDMVDLPQGRITFFVGAGRVCVALPPELPFRASGIVVAGGRLSLRPSETQPGLFKVMDVAPAEIERILEDHNRSPHDFPIELV